MANAGPAELLRAGVAAAQEGRKDEARRLLLQVTEIDERNEQAWLWLSGVVDAFEDRRVCLENVLAINPENTHARAGLQWLDQHAPPVAAEPQERCPHCDAPIPNAGSTCPHCGRALIVACPNCGEYTDIVNVLCTQCGQLLGDYRDGARYHLGLAEAYRERQHYSLAQETIARAEDEAPHDPDVLKEVAALHQEMGHTDMALAAYERAAEFAPDDGALYAQMGAIYRKRAMPDEARQMYTMAVRRSGNDPETLCELAQIYIEDGATDTPLKLLEHAVRVDQDHARSHLLLGDLYLDQGQGKRAVEHYERAVELTTPDAYLGQEARRKLAKWRPEMPKQAQGWGETLRLTAGLMVSPVLATLINASFRPLEISLVAWGAMALAAVGAYLWVCASDVPGNAAMRVLFGKAGLKGPWRQALVGVPGVVLWGTAFGLILLKM
jgi:tetratricopeptide (TPR) repeat protein